MKNIDTLLNNISETRNELLNHSIYSKLKSEDAIAKFMETHVFAVWDFMSLVKALQIDLTSVELPWTPTKDNISRRLINEIVLGEESDIDQQENPTSHYELYLEAMETIGANTEKIKKSIHKFTLKTFKNIKSCFGTIQNVKINILHQAKEFYENFEYVKEYFAIADDVLKKKLSKIILEGPKEDLNQTVNTQPSTPKAKTGILTVCAGSIDTILTPGGSATDAIPRYTIVNPSGPFSGTFGATGYNCNVVTGAWNVNVAGGLAVMTASTNITLAAGKAMALTAGATIKAFSATIHLN